MVDKDNTEEVPQVSTEIAYSEPPNNARQEDYERVYPPIDPPLGTES